MKVLHVHIECLMEKYKSSCYQIILKLGPFVSMKYLKLSRASCGLLDFPCIRNTISYDNFILLYLYIFKFLYTGNFCISDKENTFF